MNEDLKTRLRKAPSSRCLLRALVEDAVRTHKATLPHPRMTAESILRLALVVMLGNNI